LDNKLIILITLIAYQIVLVGIGLWASKRTKDNDDFFLGGRKLGPIVASISYSASSSSAWVLLGFTGMVYSVGISSIWFIPGVVLGHYSSWKWIAPAIMKLSHEKKYLTPTDILAGDATGATRKGIAITASLFIIVSFAFYVAAQFHASGNTFSASFDISFESSVLIGAGIILIYTLLGGFWAVSITDTLQGMIMFGVSIILPIAALYAVGGPSGLLEGLEGKVTAQQLSLTGGNGALMFLGYIVGLLGLSIETYGQPHLLTRFMALRDDKALSEGRMITTIWFAIVFIAMYVVGLSGHILIGDVANPETAFFGLANVLLPGLFAGIVSAAVLSAIMSTADSQLLVAASAVSHDLGLEKRSKLSPITISRIVITLLCAASVWITLQIPSDIFTRVTFAWAALGSAFGPIMVGRAFNLRMRPSAILVAMILGFVLTVYFHFAAIDSNHIFERIVPFFISLAILILVPVKERLPETQAAE
jgi:sodium/proline symporter